MKTLLTACITALTLMACGQTKEEMEGSKWIEKVYTEADELPFEVEFTDEEWKERLTPEQYNILRQRGTERAFTGKYWNSTEVGTYYSAATGQALFRSDAKFDSSCGWPSFFEPIDKDAIVYRADNAFGMRRIEIVDSKSGSHLGHVFNDGPPPTGLRYCLNSEAMIFVPDGEDPAKYSVPGF
jgi:peptide-methionine (R)-S-oxide reductase